MIIIEIEDHVNGTITRCEAENSTVAHDELTKRGFSFVLKRHPSEYLTEHCIWSMDVDNKEVSAMVHTPAYPHISHLPENLIEKVKEMRIRKQEAGKKP